MVLKVEVWGGDTPVIQTNENIFFLQNYITYVFQIYKLTAAEQRKIKKNNLYKPSAFYGVCIGVLNSM